MLDKRDKIDEILKNRYDNDLHAEVPAWDVMFSESELNKIATRKGFLYKHVAVISAVAALIAIGIFFTITGGETGNQTIITPTNNISAEISSTDRSIEPNSTKSNIVSIQPLKKTITKADTSNYKSATTPIIEQKINSPQQEEPQRSTKDKPNKSEQKPENKNQFATHKTQLKAKASPSKQRGKLSIIAATSFMPSAAGEPSAATPAMYDSPITVNINNYRNSVNFDKDEYQHKFPVNISLAVRYEIINRLFVNGGINYSYMESSVKNTEKTITYSLTQRVNYIGIPLALNYDFLRTNHFLMYGTAGGMVEFNVGATNSIESYSNDKHISTQKNKISTDNPLFSLQAGIGAKYNITGGFGIFVEPGINYVFNNPSQPITYKTKSPLQFNLKIGLSIDL